MDIQGVAIGWKHHHSLDEWMLSLSSGLPSATEASPSTEKYVLRLCCNIGQHHPLIKVESRSRSEINLHSEIVCKDLARSMQERSNDSERELIHTPFSLIWFIKIHFD